MSTPPSPLATAHAGLFAEHRHTVFNAAFHLLGDTASAEDVLQDVFTSLVKQRELPHTPRAWLLTATLNRVRDRARRARPDAACDLDLLPGATTGPMHAAAVAELARDVARALASLPLLQREVVVLHAFEDLSFAAIGALCGISQDTAASRWRYACARLRPALERKGVKP